MPVHPATVLVVDDEVGVRMVIARTLLGAGFTVLEADNGQSALRVVRSHEDRITLAIVDINMPVMTGSDFARELGAVHPDVPVLFITGRDPLDPVTHLLRKPFGADLLLETVAQVLGQPAPSERAPV